jgi:hypothetical protein
MKTSIKAALLSGFVFPGLGQMYLRRYVRGLVLMVLVLVCLGILIARVTASALQGLDAIQLQGENVDMNAVANLAAASSTQGDSYSSLIWLGIFGCWLFAVIDAYRLGKEKDRCSVEDKAEGE